MARKPSSIVQPFGTEPGPRRRPARVADAIRQEVAVLLLRAIKDPRVQEVTITEVQVTDDLRRAVIYYSVPGDQEQGRQAAQGLASARGFIRKHLAAELRLRYVPELVFKRDLSMARQAEMERLLEEIRDENEPSP